ncbi:MAG: porin family protein [Bdellovibrionales bacterium]|nr:porin family protein [Bdellovibrionales bacterium]
MKKLILFTAFALLPYGAYAQDAIYLSGMLGLGQVDVDGSSVDFDTELTFGGRAGLLFNDHVSAGIFVMNFSTDKTYLGSRYEMSALPIMGEVTYFVNEADENTFWVSGLLGVTGTELKTGAGTIDDSETSVGFSVGYHFMVAPNFSLSPQFTYIKVMGDSATASDASLMAAFANVTFWL